MDYVLVFTMYQKIVFCCRQLVLFKKGFFAVGLIPTFQRMKELVSSLTLKKTKTKFKTAKKPVKIFRAPFDLIGKFSA